MGQARDRNKGRPPVDGWLVLDKPVGMLSTRAVDALKRLLGAPKAGHAGTLDPLASGILPVAFGEATKTVPYVQDGEKEYFFSVAWGSSTDTDDSEGAVVARSEARPDPGAVLALVPSFVGRILQVPPAYSAVKVEGQRAYDAARKGTPLELAPREAVVHALSVEATGPDSCGFRIRCGKGTYVRAIARDMGVALGCLGHVTSLRRTRVGPFLEADAVAFDALTAESAPAALRPVEAGLSEMLRVLVDRDDAAALRTGRPVLLRGAEAPPAGAAFASWRGRPVAVGEVEGGYLRPVRAFA